MNNVVLVGRLARDPDVRYNASQMAIARFTVAVDRQGRGGDDQQSADFISCVAFGKSGEFVEKYFTKGKLIGIQGRIQTGSYKKQDGTTVYTTDVVAERIEFVGSKTESGGSGDYTPAPRNNQTSGQVPPNFTPLGDGFEKMDDDDMPF